MNTNQVVIEGNLTRDPELSYTPGGKAHTKGGLANTPYKGAPSGFYDFDVWGYGAENVASSFKKGDRVIITGRLDFQQWEKDDKKFSKVSINATHVAAATIFATVEISKVLREDAAPKTDIDALEDEF